MEFIPIKNTFITDINTGAMETFTNLLHNVYCPLLLITGLGIRLFVGTRQFNRRGLGGLQHFNNYFLGLITLSIEWLLKRVASFLMLWGLWGWLFR